MALFFACVDSLDVVVFSVCLVLVVAVAAGQGGLFFVEELVYPHLVLVVAV